MLSWQQAWQSTIHLGLSIAINSQIDEFWELTMETAWADMTCQAVGGELGATDTCWSYGQCVSSPYGPLYEAIMATPGLIFTTLHRSCIACVWVKW